MELELANRGAVVTGASVGIGRGIALALAREGVRLLIVARREALLAEVAEFIVRAGGPAPELLVDRAHLLTLTVCED